ncbi:MAG TPA: PKD domain-containing protein, partial [Thermoanaerobaculia bacterium]|nr:PKD domain-containing protein [Thermoanaerobaculia bacterium]
VFLEPLPAPHPAPTGPAGRFQVYQAPGGLGTTAGEPSVGIDWATGVVATQSDVHTLFTTFDDCSSPAADTWTGRDAATSVIDFDPILFTDYHTGRAFTSLLVTDPVLFTTGCSLSSHTDNDGATWLPDDGCGHPGGSDHQSLGGGPYHAPFPTPPSPLYPDAVYYCAQDPGAFLLAPIFCARSDDGGQTFGPSVTASTTECGGLHGHLKVAPDGTVYLPNRQCSSATTIGAGVLVSTDNGTTWTSRVVPGSDPSASDPSVATGLNNTGKPLGQPSNTVYLGYCDGDGHPKVAVSHNQGAAWGNVFDVGASAGIENCVFPEMVAGDDNRAMLFFLGTPTPGDFQDPGFTGVWHAYVASTYDGGATWGLADATPDQPVQIGCVWLQGGSNACRNLLDFNDASVDRDGRFVGVMARGCVAPGCTAGSPADASRSALDTLIRQSGGKRLFKAYDPVEPGRPGAPRLVSAVRTASGITVTWLAPDNGGAALSAYKVYRGTAAGQETLLARVDPGKPRFVDTTASARRVYFYKVAAVNAAGTSPTCGEVAVTDAPPAQSACQLPGVTLATDPAGDQLGGPTANQGLDLTELDLAEPYTSAADRSLTFTVKLANLGQTVAPQPNSIWKISWDAKDSTGNTQTFFVTFDTTVQPLGAFNYGYTDNTTNPRTDTGQCSPTAASCPQVTGTFDAANNQIVVKLNTAQALAYSPPTGSTLQPFIASFGAGTALSALKVTTQLLAGAAGTGLLATVDSTSSASYAVKGNLACAPNTAPTAVLTAAPTAGKAPLAVTFDGSRSSDPDTGIDTVASYTFNFGDGSAPVTQPGPAIAHTYAKAGTFSASLTVKDSRGVQSTNPAKVTVTTTRK